MDSAQHNLLDDLEHVMCDRNLENRAAMLRRVTDLFVGAPRTLTREQIALFDDVMARLVEKIDTSARAAFGHVLTTLSVVPPKVIRRLAADETIEVAGPILAHSEQLDEITLVESAKTKSQAHLLAISRRKALGEPVTDILVQRGDQQVVRSTVQNPGAAFSEFGYSTLVARSATDGDLAACVWSRPEIPRQHLLRLFAGASDAVKTMLTKKDPRKSSIIQEVVAQAAQKLQAGTRAVSPGYAAAQAYVRALQEAGKLDEAQLVEFVQEKKFEETAIALSLISDLPISLIERVLVDEISEKVIVIAKAAGLSWQTVRAVLLLTHDENSCAKNSLDRQFEMFTRLQIETARKAIRFYRFRERALAVKTD